VFFRGAAKEDGPAGNPGNIMARLHLAAFAALTVPALAPPANAQPLAVPPAAAAPAPVDAAPAPAGAAPAPAEPPAPAAPVAIEATPVAMPEPGPPCGVRVVRAPADLREQVETHLEADGSACGGVLDVWLVPSNGGVYVQARDRAGRLRERQVPDAAIAATLIASWVEIDAAAPIWAPPPPAPAVVAEPAPAAPALAPPSQAGVAATAAPALVARAPERRMIRRRVGVSAVGVLTGSGMEGGGLRVAFDALRWRRFDLGVALQATVVAGDAWYSHPSQSGTDITEQARASGDIMATIRTTFRFGRLHLSPQLAFGGGVAEHDLWIWTMSDEYQMSPATIGVRAEAAIAASLPLGRRWSVEAQAGTGFATYSDDDVDDPPPVWFDGINTAMVGLRFSP
jgi:hypothetical protein